MIALRLRIACGCLIRSLYEIEVGRTALRYGYIVAEAPLHFAHADVELAQAQLLLIAATE